MCCPGKIRPNEDLFKFANFVHVVLLLTNQFHYNDLTSTSTPPLVEDEVVVMLGPSLLDLAC